MTIRGVRFSSIALMTVALVTSMLLWVQGYFLGALLLMLVSGGIGTAQPSLERGRVVLRGTPIVAMFAIMLASASGMTLAIDEVNSRFAATTEPDCVQTIDAARDAAAPASAPVAAQFIR